MLETKEFRSSYSSVQKSRTDFKKLDLSIWCYRGNEPNPTWIDIDTVNYTKLCDIDFDPSNLPLTRNKRLFAEAYYLLRFDIVLLFGLAEFKAQVAWVEDVSGHFNPAWLLLNCRIDTGRRTKVGLAQCSPSRLIFLSLYFQVTCDNCL